MGDRQGGQRGKRQGGRKGKRQGGRQGKRKGAFPGVDFSRLMDLRVDYAFKLFFGMNETRFLVSILNAVFANKKLPRTVKSLTIENPYLERHSEGDKRSVLDIRALLDDGSSALIEMHMYGIEDLKYKTIRSWARAYGEEIGSGESYSSQPPVICVAFVDGPIGGRKAGGRKFHKCCKIMDIDDKTVFSEALELHYIDMKGGVEMVRDRSGTVDPMLLKWLAVIAEKDIEDKAIIEGICREDDLIGQAVLALARLSEDKITRQEYQKRQDEIMLQRRRDRLLVEKDAALVEMGAIIAGKDAELAGMGAEIAGKDAELEQLRRQLAKLRPGADKK